MLCIFCVCFARASGDIKVRLMSLEARMAKKGNFYLYFQENNDKYVKLHVQGPELLYLVYSII